MEYHKKPGSESLPSFPPAMVQPPARRWDLESAGRLQPERVVQVTGTVLRSAAVLLTLAAAILMGSAAQTKRVVVVDDGGLPVTLAGTAKSRYSSALVYFIIINVLTSLYSVAILALHAFKHAVVTRMYWPLTISDLFTMIFLVSCNSAASAISVVAKNGNRHFGWDNICVSVSRYCAHVAAAIALSMFACVAYVALVLLTLLVLHQRL